MKNYELFEHTADIRVRIKAASLEEIFVNMAYAIFDIMAQKTNPQAKVTKEIIIRQESFDVDELFVNWLNELLSLSSAKGLVFHDFKIKQMDNNNLEAVVIGHDVRDYKINTEIKAATYHELKLEKDCSGWKAEVIFDV